MFPSLIILYSHCLLCPYRHTFILFPDNRPGAPMAVGSPHCPRHRPQSRTPSPWATSTPGDVSTLQDTHLDLTGLRRVPGDKSFSVGQRGSKEILKTTDRLFPTVQPLAGDGARTKSREGTSKGAWGGCGSGTAPGWFSSCWELTLAEKLLPQAGLLCSPSLSEPRGREEQQQQEEAVEGSVGWELWELHRGAGNG